MGVQFTEAEVSSDIYRRWRELHWQHKYAIIETIFYRIPTELRTHADGESITIVFEHEKSYYDVDYKVEDILKFYRTSLIHKQRFLDKLKSIYHSFGVF